MDRVTVTCSSTEIAYFNPPPSQTCSEYASAFVFLSGGYLTNPSATSDCGYCAYRNGVEYLATLNVKPSDKWPYLGIFAAYVIINWILVYFMIYTFRIKGWTFGLGTLFGRVKKLVNMGLGKKR